MFLKKINTIIILIIIVITILFSISTLLDIKYQKRLLTKELNFINSSISSEYKKRLKDSVNKTLVFIDSYYNILLKEQTNNTKLSQSNLKKLEDMIRKYTYNSIIDKNIYIWINKIINYQGGENYALRLIHPNLKNTEGKLLSTSITDIKGNFPYLEELNGIKKDGELFFTYYFKQLNHHEITEKLSFAKIYKKLDWVIATGIPMNSLNHMIEEKRIQINNSYEKHILKNLIIKIFTLLTFILLLLIMKKNISKILKRNENLNKRLSTKLRKIETNFDKFFELPLNLLIIIDEKGKIIQVNSGWEKIVGYKKEELIGKSFWQFVSRYDKKNILKKLKKLSNEQKTIYLETKFLTKQNKYKNLAWSINSQKESNNQIFYGIAQDITQLKEKSLQLNQQSKISAIAEMTIHIAHQWRQPLSIISTIASGILLKKSINDLDDDFLNNNMHKITTITQELSQTIDSFSDFFDINKEKKIFNIKNTIQKTLNLMENRFQEANQTLKKEIKIVTNLENISIKSYENELLQVFVTILIILKNELLKNTNDKKIILIQTTREQEKIIIDFFANCDNFEKTDLNKLFEYYLNNNEVKINKGITLQMCKEIINNHLKGKFKLKNSVEQLENINQKGIKFTIILNS